MISRPFNSPSSTFPYNSHGKTERKNNEGFKSPYFFLLFPPAISKRSFFSAHSMGKTVGEGIGKCILASVLIPLPAQVLRILNEPMNNRTRALNKFSHLFFCRDRDSPELSRNSFHYCAFSQIIPSLRLILGESPWHQLRTLSPPPRLFRAL